MNNNGDEDTTGEWDDVDLNSDYQEALERAIDLKLGYDTEHEVPLARYEQMKMIRSDLQDYAITEENIENIINELYS